jgi:hypothetical protein
MGFAAFQAPRRRADADARTERAEAIFGSLPKDQFPEMSRLAEQLARHGTDDNFHAGMGWLLEGFTSTKAESGHDEPSIA